MEMAITNTSDRLYYLVLSCFPEDPQWKSSEFVGFQGTGNPGQSQIRSIIGMYYFTIIIR